MSQYGGMRMPTTAKQGYTFARVPSVSVPRSVFDRSHDWKATFDAGYLIPFYLDEILPGDTFTMRSNGFCRLATPIKPIMDNMYLDTFFFFVPLRLLWTNFKKFMGEQVNPADSISYTVPQVTDLGGAATAGAGGASAAFSLADYFGFPLAVDTANTAYSVSALPFRAYNLVYNEWFRDENLQNSITVSLGDGPDSIVGWVPLRRGKRHDYFTSCLPFVQKGTAVSIPLGTSATVKTNVTNLFTGAQAGMNILSATGGATPGANKSLGVATTGNVQWNDAAIGANPVNFYPANLYADLSTAASATINALRLAFQQQKFLERDARGGTRYVELVLSHFGVRSSDARLQRPEYLGGGSTRINVSPVANTANVTAQTVPQGNLAGVGTGAWTGHGFAKSFEEHGIVLGLLSVRADLTYQQGLEKTWSRLTRFDYFWPEFAHLGEQAVTNKEIYTKANGVAGDDLVFGYQERYAEYRYKPSRITGAFRSTYPTTLDIWHLSQKFTALPTLNTTFIQETPPMTRIKAVTTEPDFICDIWNQLKCARPMPVFSVPGLIDHF